MPDTNDAEVQGIPIPRRVVQRGWDANTEEGTMPIPRKGQCRYEGRRDADAEGCDTDDQG
jgi:hypothetical protein